MIDTGPAYIRSVLPETGNGGEDDASIDLAEIIIVKFKPGLNFRAEVLYDDIGVAHQAAKDLLAIWVFEIDA